MRKPKAKTEELIQTELFEDLVSPEVTVLESPTPDQVETEISLNRRKDGLLPGLSYKFKKTGFVDWKDMISTEHIVLNKENFLKKATPIDITELSDEDLDALKKKASEKDILIKLSGYRELAQIRGYKSIISKVKYYEETNFAQATCKIVWLPNYETSDIEVETNGNADACPENTNGFSSKYLVAIAENRAFARAVRSFLHINIASQDEIKTETPIDFQDSNYTIQLSGPQGAVARKLKDAKRSFAELAQFAMVKYQNQLTNVENWEDVKDINPQDSAFLLSKFNEFLNRE